MESNEEKKKKSLLEAIDKNQYPHTNLLWAECGLTARAFYVWNLAQLHWKGLVGTASLAGLVFSMITPDKIAYTSSGQSSEEFSLAVGGPDYSVLGNEFVDYNQRHECHGNEAVLMDGEPSARFDYSGTTTSGSTFQFDVIPTGTVSANTAFGRHVLYEVVVGDGDFKHLSLKDLRFTGSGKYIKLNRINSNIGGTTKVFLESSLSTSSPNSVRIEEIVKDGAFRLRVEVNGEKFISDEISDVELEKYNTVYIALLQQEEQSIGAIFPELRICL